MHRFHCLVIGIVATMLLSMIAACSSSPGSGSQSGNQTVVLSALSRDTNPQVPDADLAAVVAGNTAFALRVFPRLGESADENTFFSPYSITEAFALLAPGARGTTLSEIEQALSFSLPQERLNPAFNKLDLLMAGKTAGTPLGNDLNAPKMTIANAIWGQQGATILSAYLDTLALNYGAGLHLVDFENATEAARTTINDWVAGNTNQRILDLIPSRGVTRDTRFVLTNTIWFKADWSVPFLKEKSSNKPFVNRNGSSSTVPFINGTLALPFAEKITVAADGAYQAVEIPYAGGELSMLVIMPAGGTTMDDFAASLSPALLAEITGNLQMTEVNLSMPKFTFTNAAKLKSIMQTLGMVQAFDPNNADFSGMDGSLDLYVSQIFHEAFIAVDEKGTEAAAATAITVFAGTAIDSSQIVTVTIDHPFIFLIRDRQTGLVIFMGKVVSL